MEPRRLLRVEGLAALCLVLGAYWTLDGPLWLLALLALAPDLSMLGYLSGPRIGSRTYNLAHTYTLPVALGAVAAWGESRLVLLAALVWAGHVGADRGLGYGLKYETGFRDTHLSRQPVPVAALDPEE